LAKRDIDEEGYYWEGTKVQEEESDRLCVFKTYGTTMYVLPVGVYQNGQLTHEHGTWYVRMLVSWIECKHLRQTEEPPVGEEGYRRRGILLGAHKRAARDRFCGFKTCVGRPRMCF